MLTTLRDQMAAEFQSLHGSLNTVSQRVSHLESATPQAQAGSEQSLACVSGLTKQSLGHDAEPPRHRAEPQPTREAPKDGSAQSRTDPIPWDERSVTNDPPDYNEIVYWSPEESDSEGESWKISDTTARVIQDAFSKTLSSKRRKNVKRKHPPPDSVHTKFPRLDPAIKAKLPKQAKDTDANLVRLQSCGQPIGDPA